MKKYIIIYGTRPEQIKLQPIIDEFKANNVPHEVICTCQQIISCPPDVKLLPLVKTSSSAFRQGQIMERLHVHLDNSLVKGIIVQGDTLSAYCGALYGFLEGIPVYHVEAGLRTYDLTSPYPEECFRQQIAKMTSYHFAPTKKAYKCLLKEGFSKKNVFLTGNTIVDAIKSIPTNVTKEKKEILITCHRKENIEYLQDIVETINYLVEEYPEITFTWIKHQNPNINKIVEESLEKATNLNYIKALPYSEMLQRLKNAYLVLTDSGGIQEEVALMKVPTFVLRTTTERKESLKTGACKLIGVNPFKITKSVEDFIAGKLQFKIKDCTLYGKGSPTKEIVNIILEKEKIHDQ